VGVSPLDHVLRHKHLGDRRTPRFLPNTGPANLEATTPGTYGTRYETLQHLVGAEQWYVKLLTGEVLGRRSAAPTPRTRSTSSARPRRHRLALLAVATSDDVTRIIPMAKSIDRGVVLAQVVHHGNEHARRRRRSSAQTGSGPPPLSSWAYGRAMAFRRMGSEDD